MPRKAGKHTKSNKKPPLWKKDRSKYWKEYWTENRDTILDKRRDRYKNDEEYRARIKKSRSKRSAYSRKTKKPASTQIKRSPIAVMDNKGQEFKGYDISYLAASTGRSIPCIRYWINKGVLPRTPYRGKSLNRLLFTEDMVKAVIDALEDQGFPASINAADFYDYVSARWQALDVI